MKNNARIIGTGSYLPEDIIDNAYFENARFLLKDGSDHPKSNQEIIVKLEQISGIKERRYAPEGINTSDLAAIAGKRAIENAGIDPETLDYILVAHNWGDLVLPGNESHLVPNVAAKVKHKLQIRNPNCVAYDVLFGCPGWLQCMIQASYYIKSGDANNILVIGAETISRIVDPHDMDSMLFSDGAGATILQRDPGEKESGIVYHKTISSCMDEIDYLKMGASYNKDVSPHDVRLKMDGKKVFKYGYQELPPLIMEGIRAAQIDPSARIFVLIHQANSKMVTAIVDRFREMYGQEPKLNLIVPDIIEKMGNNSVATIPVLLNQLRRGNLSYDKPQAGDVMILSSVGAGMHANVMVYKV